MMIVATKVFNVRIHFHLSVFSVVVIPSRFSNRVTSGIRKQVFLANFGKNTKMQVGSFFVFVGYIFINVSKKLGGWRHKQCMILIPHEGGERERERERGRKDGEVGSWLVILFSFKKITHYPVSKCWQDGMVWWSKAGEQESRTSLHDDLTARHRKS